MFMLINVKMPTIVFGILTFISRINFVLSCDESGKRFITLEPVNQATIITDVDS